MKSIRGVLNQWVIVLCFFITCSAQAFELPMSYIQQSTDYLIMRCNAITQSCEEDSHIKFRSLRLENGSTFYIDAASGIYGLLVYKIAVLNGKGVLLLRCDIYVEDGNITNNECVTSINKVGSTRRL